MEKKKIIRGTNKENRKKGLLEGNQQRKWIKDY